MGKNKKIEDLVPQLKINAHPPLSELEELRLFKSKCKCQKPKKELTDKQKTQLEKAKEKRMEIRNNKNNEIEKIKKENEDLKLMLKSKLLVH